MSMTMTQTNVARLKHNTVFSDIQTFLRSKCNNTEKAYEHDIRFFFKFMVNKDIEELTEDDLIYKNSHIMSYQTFLYREYRQPNGKKFSNKTINRKVNTIIALFRHLKKNDYNVDPDKLRVDNLIDDTKNIGFLEIDEIDMMLSLTENNQLKLFIMLALRTSMRKDSILTLKWDQINQSYDNPDCYIITAFDKGVKVEKEIHVNMYNSLCELKKEGVERVFSIPSSTLDYQFKKLCEKVGIDERRRVSIHSLKKAGVSYVKELTGDLFAAQMQAGHSSPSTTAKYYLKKQRNLAGMMLDEKVDDSIADNFTKEEILSLLKTKPILWERVKREMKNQKKEMLYNRKE